MAFFLPGAPAEAWAFLFPAAPVFFSSLSVLMPSSSRMVLCGPPMPSSLLILSLSGAGKCFSTSDCSTPLAVDTKSDSSSSLSTASNVLASPVDWRPITTHFPALMTSAATRITCLTLAAMHRYLKNLWCELQNWPHMVLRIFLSASMSEAASVNLCSRSTQTSTDRS